MRTFIAVEIPEDLRKKIVEIPKRFFSPQDRIKWVEEKNLHLTLRFLGEIKEEKLTGIKKAVRKIAETFSPFWLTLKGTGVFPSPHSPRVIWVGVEEKENNLKKLVLSLEEELTKEGFPKEKREWKAHLTLGRVKGEMERGRVLSFLEREREEIGEFRVKSINIMESKLTAKGPLYRVIEKIWLKGEGR